MARGKKLSRIRAWVDDHAEGMFSGDREYSWDAIGGVIMFHTGIFKFDIRAVTMKFRVRHAI